MGESIGINVGDTFEVYESPEPDIPTYTYVDGTVFRQGGLVVGVAHGVTLTEAHDRLRAKHGSTYRLTVVREQLHG